MADSRATFAGSMLPSLNPVSLLSISINPGHTQLRLTFTRPILAGTLATGAITYFGANAVIRTTGSGAYSAGTVLLRNVTGVGSPTDPGTSDWTGGAVPFTDSDGNICPPWFGMPCPAV